VDKVPILFYNFGAGENMTGYEKSPDYGVGNPNSWEWAGIVIVLALITFGLYACSTTARASPVPIVGQASVIDGDTIEIHGQRIRLWGIDAPESSQSCPGSPAFPAGRRSATALATIIGVRAVTCEDRGRDRYGRTIGQCRVGGEDVQARMARDGWAWAFLRYSRDYEGQEAEARAAARGVWAYSCKAPWDWRAARRNR
jgi:endonuclease YncB( thermonuclease family)